MTTPKPVQAYAAVSKFYPAGVNMHDIQKQKIESGFWARGVPRGPWTYPVTILPTEQYEAMVEALEQIADPLTALRKNAESQGCRLSGLAHQIAYDPHQLIKIARDALAALKEQDRG